MLFTDATCTWTGSCSFRVLLSHQAGSPTSHSVNRITWPMILTCMAGVERYVSVGHLSLHQAGPSPPFRVPEKPKQGVLLKEPQICAYSLIVQEEGRNFMCSQLKLWDDCSMELHKKQNPTFFFYIAMKRNEMLRYTITKAKYKQFMLSK